MKGDFNALTGSLTSIDFLNYQSLRKYYRIWHRFMVFCSCQCLYPAERLELAGNAISGPFPNSIFNISSIALIDVSSNAITGSFGENLGKASSLQQLVVSRNPISGTIPTQIGTLGQLNSLVLEYCQFSGTIPTEIGNCPKLRTFFFCRFDFANDPGAWFLTQSCTSMLALQKILLVFRICVFGYQQFGGNFANGVGQSLQSW